MSDAISNSARMTPLNASLRGPTDSPLDTKSSATATAEVVSPAKADQVSLSHVTEKALAQPDFDRAKVDAIKQAIKNGRYPLNPRGIAEGFVSLESLISH